MSKRKHLPCDDYVLTKDGAWFTINGFAVRIFATHQGLAVDVYADGREYNDALQSLFVFNAELEEDQ